MNRKLFYFFIIPLISLASYSQSRNSNDDLFAHGDVNYFQLLDSNLIAKAGYNRVEIGIMDSINYRQAPTGVYMENLYFNFSPSGKMTDGLYSLSDPKLEVQKSLLYQYYQNFSVLQYSIENTNGAKMSASFLTNYSLSGSVLSEKQWPGINRVTTFADTAKWPEAVTINTYDASGFMTANRYALYNADDTSCCSIKLIDKKERRKNIVCTYQVTRSGKNQTATDTIHQSYLYNSSNRLIEFYEYKTDTSIVKKWQYDAAGRLINYSFCQYSGSNQSEITEINIVRTQVGLPFRITYESGKIGAKNVKNKTQFPTQITYSKYDLFSFIWE